MSRRRLSSDERVLWKGVTRSIAPLRKVSEAETDDDVPAPAAPAPRPRARPAPMPAALAAPPKPATPSPPLATLGRKTKKRIARGAHAIDGRLDLHGMTQAEAHDALFGFLRAKQARGSKVVLVITGKGARGGELRRPRRAQPHGADVAAAAGIPRPYPGLRERRSQPRRRRRAVCELAEGAWRVDFEFGFIADGVV